MTRGSPEHGFPIDDVRSAAKTSPGLLSGSTIPPWASGIRDRQDPPPVRLRRESALLTGVAPVYVVLPSCIRNADLGIPAVVIPCPVRRAALAPRPHVVLWPGARATGPGGRGSDDTNSRVSKFDVVNGAPGRNDRSATSPRQSRHAVIDSPARRLRPGTRCARKAHARNRARRKRIETVPVVHAAGFGSFSTPAGFAPSRHRRTDDVLICITRGGRKR